MTMTTAEAFEEIRAHHRALGEQLTQRAEAVSSAVASGRPYAAAVGGFREVLPHAAAEEKTIYPLAAAHAELAGMVGEMTAEHVTLSAAGSRLASTSSASDMRPSWPIPASLTRLPGCATARPAGR
jgi:hemerythrin HHE cation binding domain-containing protein